MILTYHSLILLSSFNIKPNILTLSYSNPMYGGDGYPDDTIEWIRIDDTFNTYPELRWNYGNYKMAILDTGLDRPTWNYFYNRISSTYLDLHLIDRDGRDVSRDNALDVAENHHGSALTSLIINLLQRKSKDVCMSLYMFIVSEEPSGEINKYFVEDQLNWIINYNNQHPNSPFKVISLSWGSLYTETEPVFYDELNTLINQHDCIVVAASGNSYSLDEKNRNQVLEWENVRIQPATYSDVIGAGGIYGEPASDDYERLRMSVTYPLETGGVYVGSMFWQDHGMGEATVDCVCPTYKIEMKNDLDNDGLIENILATGTSMAAPQVAVTAYLAARMRYYLDPAHPLTLPDFFACLHYSCENDIDGRVQSSSIQLHWEKVGKPTNNLGYYSTYYSYRVGFGCLDVEDLIEYLCTLS